MSIVLAILVFQSFIMALTLLINKSAKNHGAAWIATYFIISGIYFLGLYSTADSSSTSINLFQGIGLLLAPLINPVFFIAWRTINGYPNFSSRHFLLHMLPFVSVLIIMTFVFLIKGIEFAGLCIFLKGIIPGIKVIFNIQWIIYLFLILHKLFGSRDRGWTEKQWKINAGGILLGSYIVGYLLHCIELYEYYSSGTDFEYLFPLHSNLLIVFTFVTTNFLLFRSLDHQKVTLNAVTQVVANGEQWERARLEFHHLKRALEDQGLFRNSDLSLATLAEKTGIKERTISTVINAVTNKGFNEYINELRINEAKTLLMDSNKSIKEIQYDVGFKSRTTFFDTFKKVTGKTPGEFRAEIGS
jgi:AraC-like DNA-binding protein